MAIIMTALQRVLRFGSIYMIPALYHSRNA